MEQNTNARLSHVEMQVASLSSDFKNLATSFQSFTNNFTSFTDQIRNSQRTNWGVLISAISVSLVVAGLFATSIQAPLKSIIENQERRVSKNEEKLDTILEQFAKVQARQELFKNDFESRHFSK